MLQAVEDTKDPVLVSKGRKIKAVLISYEDFQRRFIDKQAEDEKRNWILRLETMRAPRVGAVSSHEILRELRGRRI